MKYTYENCAVSTDEGFVIVAEVLGEHPPGWGVTVFRYVKDGGRFDAAQEERIADAITDSEANARAIAEALAHLHLCADCRNEGQRKTRGAKRASN